MAASPQPAVAQAQAQDGATDAEADMALITITATRNPGPVFDYPGQVTVLNRAMIEGLDPSTLQDVFRAIPGAQFDSGPRRTGDTPVIRGLGGNGVLIFQDGARQSFVSGHDGRFFIDPELIQSVEVVRGPGSALYGSGALGGVIAVRTVSARDLLADGETVHMRLVTGFQSVNDEFRAGVTGAAQSRDGMWDVLGHVTYRDSGSIALGSGDLLPADDAITSSLAKLTVRPAEAVELRASFSRYRGDSSDPQNPQGANLAGAGNPLVFRDVRNDTAQLGLAVDPASDAIDLNVVGYFSRNAVDEDEAERPRIAAREVETLGFSIDNRSRFALGDESALTLTYGGEYYRDTQRGLDTATADGTRGGVPDARTTFAGLFLQAELALTDDIPGEIIFIPGIRWDSFRSSADGESFAVDAQRFSPKIGLTYKPVPELLVFGNWSRGFRAPSVNEAFADGVHFTIPDLSAPPGMFGPSFVQNLFIGNGALLPETSDAFELGAGVDLRGLLARSDGLEIKGSYYRSTVDNLIGLDVQTPLGCFVPGPFTAPCGSGPAFGNTSQNVNIANAEIDGIEIAFTYDSEYVYARGHFATIDGVDTATGDFLEGVLQPDQLFVDAGIRLGASGLRLGGRLTVAATFDAVNSPVDIRDGYTVGDLYLSYQPESGPLRGFRLDLGVDNVGDADFEVVNAGVSQPGANIKAALSWSHGF